MKREWKNAVDVLNAGGIGVIPTDTIYGIVARAYDSDAIERVYTVRKREGMKPCLVLIASIDDIASFDIDLSQSERDFLMHVWEGDVEQRHAALARSGCKDVDDNRPVSVVVSCTSDRFLHIHRGKKSIGFRVPRTNEVLMATLEKTGPLIAPSANIAGVSYVGDINAIKDIFLDTIDFYVCDSKRQGIMPSMVLTCDSGGVSVLRA